MLVPLSFEHQMLVFHEQRSLSQGDLYCAQLCEVTNVCLGLRLDQQKQLNSTTSRVGLVVPNLAGLLYEIQKKNVCCY